MENIQVFYKNGCMQEIEGSNGTYSIIVAELTKRKPAKFVKPPESSRYKYCISLEDVIGVKKVDEQKNETTFGFLR